MNDQVPYGSFKAVPITWESDVLSDARRMKDPRATPAVEKEHVRDLYDTIADDWHRTRWRAWPRVTEFVKSLEGELGSVRMQGSSQTLPQNGILLTRDHVCALLKRLCLRAFLF